MVEFYKIRESVKTMQVLPKIFFSFFCIDEENLHCSLLESRLYANSDNFFSFYYGVLPLNMGTSRKERMGK